MPFPAMILTKSFLILIFSVYFPATKHAVHNNTYKYEINSGVQLDTSPIANGFVARLATKAMIYVDIINIYLHYNT